VVRILLDGRRPPLPDRLDDVLERTVTGMLVAFSDQPRSSGRAVGFRWAIRITAGSIGARVVNHRSSSS
jgi:hypothetical protein